MDHPTRWALVSRKLISNQRCIVESIMAPFFGGLIDTLGIIIIALFGFVKLSQVEAKYRHQVHWYLKNAS